MSLLDVPVGFGDPLQRISPVDHRLQLPRLGELPEPDEIVAAMLAFRSDERPSTVMGRIAKGFSDDEIRAIALWLAAQEEKR